MLKPRTAGREGSGAAELADSVTAGHPNKTGIAANELFFLQEPPEPFPWVFTVC